MEIRDSDKQTLLAAHKSTDVREKRVKIVDGQYLWSGRQAHDDGKSKLTSAFQELQRNDRIFGYSFGINIALMTFLAIAFGVPNVKTLNFTIHESKFSDGTKFFGIAMLSSLIGGIVSFLWLQILQRYVLRVVSATLRLSISICLIMGVLSIFDAGMGGRAIGFINLFVALFISVYYVNCRPSMAFASSNLSVGTKILHKFPQLLSITGFAILSQAVLTILWLLSIVGALSIVSTRIHDINWLGNAIFFMLLISYYWSVQVCKNTIHCITAGTVGEWWAGISNADSVSRSKQRSLTTSFGSICFGSLLVAALSALKTLFDSTAQRNRYPTSNAFLSCALRTVSYYAQYFTRYAFCHVAIYGKDFVTSGRDTMQLLRNRGWSALVNETLITSVLSAGSLIVGIISGGIGAIWVHLTLRCTNVENALHPDACETFNLVIMSFVACAFIGFAMCSTVSCVLESIVITIFICFAENPVSLERHHPEEHAELVNAWSIYKPELLLESV